MKFISHRGNIEGPYEIKENSPNYIIEAINNGFDVEIDVRVVEGKIYLGHDIPQYQIDMKFLIDNSSYLWCHCKNIDAMVLLQSKQLHCFSHDKDSYVFTNRGVIWSYPSRTHNKNAISVLPEMIDVKCDIECLGICSDYIKSCKDIVSNQPIR